jgi:hypothetical protein
MNNTFQTCEHFSDRESFQNSWTYFFYLNDLLVWTFMLFEHFFKMNIYVIWTILNMNNFLFERQFNMNNYIIWTNFQIKLFYLS